MPTNELVQSWLLKAVHDLETAKIVAIHMPDFDEVDMVSRYAVQIRYPDSIIKLTSYQIQEAITLADLIFTLVKEKIF